MAVPAVGLSSMVDQTRRLELDHPVLLQPTFNLLRRGAGDPTHRRVGEVMLRATRTPVGPALLHIVARGRHIGARAWGDGAEWALHQLPRLVGADDDPGEFRPLPQHASLVDAHRRYVGYRVGCTDAVFEALAPACLEQVVTGAEAFRAWRLLVREFGEPAPGPTQDPRSIAYGMRLPPAPEVWRRVPSWRFLAAGVEQRRSRTLVNAAPRAAALDDDACTEILEPYRGHRFRVQMLLLMAGFRVPRKAPRMSLPTHTPYATHG